MIFIHPVLSAIVVPFESVAQITVDDDNRGLDYPVAVDFDPDLQEIYIVNGSTGRIVVYGPDFFPRVSMGAGRGVVAPRGLSIAKNGQVYVCQIPNAENPSPRITIMNAAFFTDSDIFLDQIPEAANFRAEQVAISVDRRIYLAGRNNRGVMVLNDDGSFLRFIKPEGEVSARILNSENEKEGGLTEDNLDTEIPGSKEIDKELPEEEIASEEGEEDLYANIPEEFRPRSSEQRGLSPESGDVIAPVKVNSVAIEDDGKIYLISSEVGKIFVYGADESFLFSFGEKGGSPGQMSQPVALAVDEEREIIYVVDYMRHTVLVFNLEGEYLFEVGGRGVGPGWFNFPSSIAINNQGEIIVADLFNKRVQVLSVGYEDVIHLINPDSRQGLQEEGIIELETDVEQEFRQEGTGLVEEIFLEDEDISTYPENLDEENIAPDTEQEEGLQFQ